MEKNMPFIAVRDGIIAALLAAILFITAGALIAAVVWACMHFGTMIIFIAGSIAALAISRVLAIFLWYNSIA